LHCSIQFRIVDEIMIACAQEKKRLISLPNKVKCVFSLKIDSYIRYAIFHIFHLLFVFVCYLLFKPSNQSFAIQFFTSPFYFSSINVSSLNFVFKLLRSFSSFPFYVVVMNFKHVDDFYFKNSIIDDSTRNPDIIIWHTRSKILLV